MILSWILAFLVLSGMAGALGFGSVAAASLAVAKFLGAVFVTLTALTIASSLLRRQDHDALAP